MLKRSMVSPVKGVEKKYGMRIGHLSAGVISYGLSLTLGVSDNMELEVLRQSDSHVNVTEEVECYKNGKTFECECGHGIGVGFDVSAVTCYDCGKICVDRHVDKREAPDVDDGQATLAQF